MLLNCGEGGTAPEGGQQRKERRPLEALRREKALKGANDTEQPEEPQQTKNA